MEIIDKSEIGNRNKVNTQLNNIILKEDLERYYIDEKKSMVEISKIYGCSDVSIATKLEKHGIPIRPKGAFLVCDDGETLSSKRNSGEISQSEYSIKIIKNMGYKNRTDYLNKQVKKRGYNDWNDYIRKNNHKKGLGSGLPMSENKNCSMYLGVHICENKEFLSKIINIIESMPNNNPGYDVVCRKGKKIDVKCACLGSNNTWIFAIYNNKIADYFLMISFDNRKNLKVEHMWLVKGDAVIEKTNAYQSREFIVNEKDIIHIGKGNRSLKRWIKHEINDSYKLKEVQKVCDIFKNI